MSASPIRLVKRYLCIKKLTVNDGFTNKSVKIPRAEGRFFMGELRNRQTIPLVLLDEDGNCWELLCTCTGAQYALSHIGAFCESRGARPGCYFIFYADHEHIVRLAVRQQLPEDVQAAVAAARAAALTARASPQRSSQPDQPQQQPGSASTLPGVNAPSSQAVVFDDPVALDEMPLTVTMTGTRNALAGCGASAVFVAQVAVPAPAKQLAGAEVPPKSMPLQDRSNIRAGVSIAESVCASNALKPSKPNGAKPSHGAAVTGAPAVGYPARGAVADKENDATALAASPAVKATAQPSASLALGVSTGGLHAPAQAGALHPLQQQSPAPRPSLSPPLPHPKTPLTPAMPNLQLSRSPACQPAPSPSPSPATRQWLRFEARLRAQAGRPHPLSVRTGPDSPLPSTVGGEGPYGWRSPPLSSFYALEGNGGGFLGSSLPPPSWAATAPLGANAAPAGFHHDLANPGPCDQHDAARPCPAASAVDSVTGTIGTAFPIGASVLFSQQQRPAPVQQPPGGCLEDLTCGERVDWEAERRAARNAATSAGAGVPRKPPGFTSATAAPQLALPRCHTALEPLPSPPPPPPPRSIAASGPAPTITFAVATATAGNTTANDSNNGSVNMGLLRQLLLLQGGHLNHPLHSGAMSAGGSGRQLHQQQQMGRAPEGPCGGCKSSSLGQPTLPPGTGQDGLMPSPAVANPTAILRRLLGLHTAWDLAALSGAAADGQLSQAAAAAGEGSRQYSTGLNSTQGEFRPVVVNQAQTCGGPATAVNGAAPPCVTKAQDGAGCFMPMDIDSGAGALPQEQNQLQQEQDQGLDKLPSGGEMVDGLPSSGATQPKSRLSLERDVREAPADPLPSCKRQRLTTPEQQRMQQPLLAKKELTAQDLLTDRVALSLAPQADCALRLGHHRLATHAGTAATAGAGSISVPQASPNAGPTGQATAGGPGADAGGQLCSMAIVHVDVLVESGANYGGLLVRRVAGAAAGVAPAFGCEPVWELQGLRPYLIRRQAGVGDVLRLAIEEAAAADLPTAENCRLRLAAQLQRCEVAQER